MFVIVPIQKVKSNKPVVILNPYMDNILIDDAPTHLHTHSYLSSPHAFLLKSDEMSVCVWHSLSLLLIGRKAKSSSSNNNRLVEVHLLVSCWCCCCSGWVIFANWKSTLAIFALGGIERQTVSCASAMRGGHGVDSDGQIVLFYNFLGAQRKIAGRRRTDQTPASDGTNDATQRNENMNENCESEDGRNDKTVNYTCYGYLRPRRLQQFGLRCRKIWKKPTVYKF